MHILRSTFSVLFCFEIWIGEREKDREIKLSDGNERRETIIVLFDYLSMITVGAEG